jgi:hypothetical protein
MAIGKKTGGRKPGVPNKATRELKELAQPHAPKAIKTLLWIMEHGETEAARVAAAKELLDRGYGRPSGSGTQVNVNAASGQLNITCSEEERQRLITQRERLMSAKAPSQASQTPTDAPKPASGTQAKRDASEPKDESPATLLEAFGPGDYEPPTLEAETF